MIKRCEDEESPKDWVYDLHECFCKSFFNEPRLRPISVRTDLQVWIAVGTTRRHPHSSPARKCGNKHDSQLPKDCTKRSENEYDHVHRVHYVPERNKNKQYSFFVYMPAKHERYITAKCQCDQERLVSWCPPEFDQEYLEGKSQISMMWTRGEVAYHLESDGDDECMWRFDIRYHCEDSVSYETPRSRRDAWCVDREIKSSPSYNWKSSKLGPVNAIFENIEGTHIAKAHDQQQ